MGGVDIPTSQAVPAPFPGEPPIEMMWSIRREAHPMADTMYDTDPKLDIAVPSGTIGVWVDNRDGIHHTFTIEDLGVDLEIPALKAKRVQFDAPPGTYEIICTVPGHESMTGALTVGG